MDRQPKDYSDLPNWPRLMPADLACRYVGWSKTGFLGRVGKLWPEPLRLGGKVLWDRRQLDAAVDALTGTGEPLVDPLMEAIKGMGASAEPAVNPYREAIRGAGKQADKRKGRGRR